MKTLLTALALCLLLTFAAAPAPAATTWYPDNGSWDGTAPACNGNCSNTEFAWCVGMNPGCAYSDAYSPPGFGDYCSSGRKAYCVPTASYPQLLDYGRLNQVGGWYGTAPSCSGSCPDNYFALCRSSDGDSCDYSGGINASQLQNFGSDCWSGRKVFCVPTNYISGQ